MACKSHFTPILMRTESKGYWQKKIDSNNNLACLDTLPLLIEKPSKNVTRQEQKMMSLTDFSNMQDASLGPRKESKVTDTPLKLTKIFS